LVVGGEQTRKPKIRIPSSIAGLGVDVPYLSSGFGSKLSTLFSMADDGYPVTTNDLPVGQIALSSSRNSPMGSPRRVSSQNDSMSTANEAPYELMPRSSIDERVPGRVG
jgi:hypothetical protein